MSDIMQLSHWARETLWRGSPIVEQIRQVTKNGRCGALCSLRFTWMRPVSRALPGNIFNGDLWNAAQDAAEFISGSKVEQTEMKAADSGNVLFALAKLENGVVAEYEFNEMLPDSMPDIFFVKANFTQGHVTNQPLTGYFNTEGMIFADDSRCCHLIPENPELPPAEGPIEQMIQCRQAMKDGER